jgi:opacity protein-like surface antigen
MLKKALFSALIIPVFYCDFAFAEEEKTPSQGFQIGIDGTYTYAKHRYITDTHYISVRKFRDSALGYGANIKYAFNLDNIFPAKPLIPVFIAPEIFFERIGTTTKDITSQSTKINNRYGAKLNLGFDITNYFFIYGTGGYGVVSYDIDWRKSANMRKKSSANDFLYGGGIGFHLGEHFIISFEYTMQKIDLKTPGLYTGNPQTGTIKTAQTTLEVLKFGIGYQF